MTLFQKKSAPKKLSIKEIWRLYQALRTGISSAPKQYMIDEIIQIMENISQDNFKDALGIMYGWGMKEPNPAKIAFMFSVGLKKTNFFSFTEFIRTLNGIRNVR